MAAVQYGPRIPLKKGVGRSGGLAELRAKLGNPAHRGSKCVLFERDAYGQPVELTPQSWTLI
jgi:hypothetical protein